MNDLNKDIKKNKINSNPSTNTSKSILENINSKYIIEQIFDNLLRRKMLQIIKYNKHFQKKLNISKNDYKNFIEIEIELIPEEYSSGQFINILNKKDRLFYHIFFDDYKNEIDRNYINYNESISKIKIIIDYEIKSFEKLFQYCDCIKSISFLKFYRNDINNMSSMFYQCNTLKKLDLSKLITNNVSNMAKMFYNCSSLEELNLTNFNTKNVKDMSSMFEGCISLKKLDISNFNTINVSDMSHMFLSCKSLEKINLSNFNVNNAINMNLMFIGCSDNLKKLVKEQNKNIKSCAY